MIGIERQCTLASRGRLVEPAEVAEAGAEIVEDRDVGRVDRRDLSIDLDRLRKLSGLMQREPELPQCSGIRRGQFCQINRRHILGQMLNSAENAEL
jgi:hypothetical protein